MRVLFVASECAPLVKVGGLADVVGGLPKALQKLGADVAIAIPKYESLSNLTNPSTSLRTSLSNLNVDYAGKQEQVLVYQTFLPATDIPIYLFENPKYLSTGSVYSAKSAEGTTLDIDRFSFFSKSVTEFLNSSFVIRHSSFDVIHCHDWHTAWIPLLIQNYPRTLLTIHNMGKMYQGRTDKKIIEKLELTPNKISNISNNSDRVNILLQGIVNADLINTVSPTYAREIQTAEYGEDLYDILGQYKTKLSGILNGIDYEVWNPETDKNLVTNYNTSPPKSPLLPGEGKGEVGWQEGKKRNKTKLLETVGLPQGENVPTFGMVTRVAEQKGFEILIPALEQLFNRHSGERSDSRITSSVNDSGQARMTSSDDVRVIILGVGDPDLEFRISNLGFKYKNKLKFITRFDDMLAHLIYAGADFFLVPSRFEPSGLTQLVAMRYGTLPIVRKTGGLVDSVEDGKTGFVFEEYSSEALLNKLEEAIQVYRHSGEPEGRLQNQEILKQVQDDTKNDSGQARMTQFKGMVNSAMQMDFSWDKSAGDYLELYRRLILQ